VAKTMRLKSAAAAQAPGDSRSDRENQARQLPEDLLAGGAENQFLRTVLAVSAESNQNDGVAAGHVIEHIPQAAPLQHSLMNGDLC